MKGRLSIDFGAAATKAATSDGGVTEVLTFGDAFEYPTLVYLSDQYLKGETRKATVGAKAASYTGRAGQRLVTRLKHHVGAIGSVPPLERTLTVDGHQIALVDLVAEVLAVAVRKAPGSATSPTVLTHPVAWAEPEKALLCAALKKAGRHERPMFISEPEAAAHFAVEHGIVSLAEGAVAVFDLGASTFDAAVIEQYRGATRTLASHGVQIGGDDFDAALLDFIAERYGEISAGLGDEFARFRNEAPHLAGPEARRVKELLSTQETAVFNVSDRFPDLDLNVDDLYDAIEDAVERCLDAFVECLNSCPASTELSTVILTGGSSQIPLVQQQVAEVVGRRHPEAAVFPVQANGLSPGQVVAPGAMVYRNTIPPKILRIKSLGAAEVGSRDLAVVGSSTVVVERGSRDWQAVDLRSGNLGAKGAAGYEMSLLWVMSGDPFGGKLITGTDNGRVETWTADGSLKDTRTPHGTFFGSLRGNGLTAVAIQGDDMAYTFEGKRGWFTTGSRSGSLPSGKPVALGLVKDPPRLVVVNQGEVELLGGGKDLSAELAGSDHPYAQKASIHPKGGVVAIVDDERGLWVFDVSGGRLRQRLHAKLSGRAQAVAALRATVGYVVAVGIDAELQIVGLDGQVLATKALDDSISQLAYTDDADRIVARVGSKASLLRVEWG